MMKYYLSLLFVSMLFACSEPNSPQDNTTEPATDPATTSTSTDTKMDMVSPEDRVFQAIRALPEVEKMNTHIDSISNHTKEVALLITNEPSREDPFFRVKVGYNGPERFETYAVFFVNTVNPADIKVEDTIEGTRLNLDDWRKSDMHM